MAGILGHSPGSTGVATITGSNSKWLAGNQFVIGDSGRGVLNIANGGAVSFGGPGYVPSCTIASAAGSSGVVTVAGTGSSWQTGEELQIGGAGDGSLDVSAGGTVSSSFGYLGYEGTSTGTATIRGDKSTWNNQSDLYVGRSGNATLYIANGGCVQTRAAYVGYNKGVTGTVTVDGTNSKWTTTDRIYIGHEGNGTLTVAGGATCRSVGGQIGYGSKSTGAVTVTGAGSTWSNSADVHVGILGNGALTILKGASVSNWGAYIGDPGSTKSAVAVDGIGSSWTNNGTLFVGNGGKGTLSTTNGANVRSNTCIIGGNYNSGLVAVDGIGSTFVNTGNVTIGNSGRLSVTGGASVANQQAVINGTVAIDGVGTTWENFIVNVGGGGTLSITGGGEVSASLGLVYISSLSTLAIDVGNGSTLSTIGNGGSAIQNYGNLRILAGAKPTAHSLYSPISANTWSGNGVNQAVGGTWDSTAHEFTVSDVQEGDSGKALVGLNLKNTQRVLIGDDEGTNPTGWRIGASFLASDVDNTLSFTATAITAVPPSGVLDLTQSESVLGAWNLAFGLGYLPRSPAYLSFDIGSGYSRDTLKIWQVNGSSWTPFDATDLNYDGQYANFTMTPFYGYAVTGAPVPEPTALAMILAAGLGGLGYAGRKRRASR
jgi:T5SS/PEP-CTERM-associated repeat protein